MKNFDYKIQNAFSNSSFSIRAMGDYIESRNLQFGKVMDLINFVTSSFSSPTSFSMTDVEHYYTEQGYGDAFDLDSYLTFSKGQISIRQLCVELIDRLSTAYSIEEYTGLDDPSFPLLSPYGTYQSGAMSWNDLSEEMKSSLYAAQALSSAFSAFSKGNTISDKLSIFNESISTSISDAGLYKDIKKYVSDILTSANSDLDFINGIFESINLPVLAAQEDDSDVVLPGQCSFSEYTGATPVTAISIPVIGPVGTLAKGLWAGVKSLWNSLNSWVDKGLEKLSNGFLNAGNTVFNPYDVYTINSQGNHTVENTFRQFLKPGKNFSVSPCAGMDEEDMRTCVPYLNNKVLPKLKGKWIKMDNYFAECMFYFADAHAQYTEFGLSSMVSTDITDLDIRYRLKPIHYRHCLAMLNLFYFPSSNPYDFSQISNMTLNLDHDSNHTSADISESIHSYILNHITDLYCTAANGLADNTGDISESDLFLSYVMTDVLHSHIASLYETFSDAHASSIPSFNDIQSMVHGLGSKITNADWIQLFTGYNGSTTDHNLFIGSTKLYRSSSGMTDKFTQLLTAIINQSLMRYVFPLDFNFLSYRINKESWSPASFAVKTDSENADNAAKLIATQLAIIISTVVISTIGSNMIRRKNALTAARRQDYYRIVGKMQRGESLTDAEVKNFTWLDKKVGFASALTSGIADTGDYSDGKVLDSTEAIYNSIK